MFGAAVAWEFALPPLLELHLPWWADVNARGAEPASGGPFGLLVRSDGLVFAKRAGWEVGSGDNNGREADRALFLGQRGPNQGLKNCGTQHGETKCPAG